MINLIINFLNFESPNQTYKSSGKAGFEPAMTILKTVVLPLNYSPFFKKNYTDSFLKKNLPKKLVNDCQKLVVKNPTQLKK
jgi:hypothetical protein